MSIQEPTQQNKTISEELQNTRTYTSHIVVDARYLKPGATGVGHYIKGILIGLNHVSAEQKVKVSAITLAKLPEDYLSFFDSLENIDICPVDVDPEDHPKNEFFFTFPINAWMKKLEADVLFCPAFFGPLGKRPFKRIVCFHDTLCWDFPENYPFSFRSYVTTYGKLSAKYADLVVCPSPGAREQIQGHNIANPKIVPYGIDYRVFKKKSEDSTTSNGHHPSPIEPKSKRIEVVFLASFERRKNHEIIFEALNAHPANQYDIHLKLLHQATTEERFEIENRTSHLNVEVVSPQNQTEIAEAFHNADFSIMPSLAEGFGAPALESMACGCPVILSSTNWFKILSAQGKRAWLADPYDPKIWAQAMVDCIEKKEETKTKAEAAYNFAQQFTWDSSAAKLIEHCRKQNFF